MTTMEIAKGLVSLCQQGKAREAMSAYYADDIVSFEAAPQAPIAEGLEAVYQKADWWESTMQVHHAEVTGPFVNGDQFAVRFVYEVTDTTTKKRNTLDEVGVYTVENGKIVKERFFYAAEMLGAMM